MNQLISQIFIRVACAFLIFAPSPLLAQQAQARSAGFLELRLLATEFGFSPAAPRVASGKLVTVILDNSKGETEHGVAFPALGLRIFAKAGEVAKRDFVFDRPGEYEFVCDLPGHMEAGMRGKLSVAASGAR